MAFQPTPTIGSPNPPLNTPGAPGSFPMVGGPPVSTTGVTPKMMQWGSATNVSVTGPSSIVVETIGPQTYTLTANAGVTSALVRIEASLDGVNFTGIATMQLSAPGTAQVPVALPYPYMRANVIAIAGGSVNVSVQGGTTPLTQSPGSQVAVNPSLSGIPAASFTILAASAIPVIFVSSGTIAAGALSAITAIDAAYKCWMYFPSGASLPQGAGLYYVEMATTTTGTIYNITLSSGVPYIPTAAQKAAAPVAGGAAYTQNISFPFVNLITITVPGGAMGANGQLRLTYHFRAPNNANNKGVPMYFNNSNSNQLCNIYTANQSQYGAQRYFANAGVTNVQQIFDATSTSIPNDLGFSGAAVQNLAVDTTVNQNLVLCPNMAVATDYIMLTNFSFEILSQA